MTVVIDGINAVVEPILVVGGLGTCFGVDAYLITLVIDELIEFSFQEDILKASEMTSMTVLYQDFGDVVNGCVR